MTPDVGKEVELCLIGVETGTTTLENVFLTKLNRNLPDDLSIPLPDASLGKMEIQAHKRSWQIHP